MKNKTYAPTSLDNYINESKTLTLKRSYGSKPSVTVGSKAPGEPIWDVVADYLRTEKVAHPIMHEIMRPLLSEFQKNIPVLFDDITY